MPWDSTELRVIALGEAAPVETTAHVLIDGDTDGILNNEDTAVLQPAWHPGTGALYYLSDSSGYYNLLRVPPPAELGGAINGPGVPILPRETDFGGAAPGWSFGQQGYAFLADGRVAAHYTDRSSGETKLLVFAEDTSGASARTSPGPSPQQPPSALAAAPLPRRPAWRGRPREPRESCRRRRRARDGRRLHDCLRQH